MVRPTAVSPELSDLLVLDIKYWTEGSITMEFLWSSDAIFVVFDMGHSKSHV